MKTCRVHIMGASGAGVSSLGRALAEALAVPHHDTDDYYWRPTTPPYRDKREAADRLRLMREVFLDRPDWILSGSLDGWGAPIVALFDLVVFVYVPTAIRLERLRAREARRLGAVAYGGSMNPAMEEFLSGPRTTTTERARGATSRGIRRGWRRCRARSCVSTGRGQCPNWSRKSVCRSTNSRAE
jgi:adenylate kinase family enzyme